MNGEAELTRLKLEQVLDVLRRLTTNEYLCLGDLVYDVRESEGKGWDGPWVKAWGQAVEDAEWHLKHVEPKWSET